MRSFVAMVAAASAASAAAVYPVESSSTPVYEAYPVSSAPAYEAEYPSSSSSAKYPVASSSSSIKYEEYPVASSSSSSAYYAASTPVYSVAYPVSSSSSIKYEEYPVTTTKVVPETTFVCPTPTVVTYEEKTYSVTKATTLTISSYSTVVIKTTKTPEVEKPSSKVETPVYSATVPPVVPTYAPYPSKNVTAPVPGTATGAYPTSTKPSTPEFTGAAAQAGVGLLAVVGALAAFL